MRVSVKWIIIERRSFTRTSVIVGKKLLKHFTMAIRDSKLTIKKTLFNYFTCLGWRFIVRGSVK